MKAIRSINLGKAALYGAVLAAFWSFVFGLFYWLIGWAFGASSWVVDMNLGNWSAYTFETLLNVVWAMLINGAIGAIAGFFVAIIYNAVAGMMGGIVIQLEDVQ